MIRNGENLKIKQYQGKKDSIALIICTCCGKTFSERKGTVFFGMHHSRETVEQVLTLYLKSMSINDIVKITGISKKTIISWIRKAGNHVNLVCEKYLKYITIKECQVDEMWTFVMMKRNTAKRKKSANINIGDEWIYLAIDPESKIIIHWHIGKHTKENTRIFLEGLKKKLGDNIPLFTSDEFLPYLDLFKDLYSRKQTPEKPCKRGRPRKKAIKIVDKDLKYAQIKKTREKGRVIKIEKLILFGDEIKIKQIIEESKVSNDINTSFIERMNATMRHCLRRLSRKSYCFSKKKDVLKSSLDLFIGYYNFVKIHLTLNKAPLCYNGIISNSWSLKELLSFRI
jgi:IS1 family transposase